MDRSAPARRGDADRLADVAAERFGRARRPRCLGHRLGHVGLAKLLEAAAAELPGRGVAGQQHHRRFRPERREQRADGIGVAGPAGDERNAGLAGQPAVRVGHVDGGGLVADVDEIEAGVERGVEDRHDVVAGEGEHALAAEALERLGYDVGAAQRLAHVGFSPRPIYRQTPLAPVRPVPAA